MKYFSIIFFLTILFTPLSILAASGNVKSYYKCTVDGKVSLSDKPCSDEEKQEKHQVKTPLSKKQKKDAKWDSYFENLYETMDKESKNTDIALSKIQIGMSKDSFMSIFRYMQSNGRYRIREGLNIHSIDTNKTKTSYGIQEQVILDIVGGRRYYYFRNGVLTTIQD